MTKLQNLFHTFFKSQMVKTSVFAFLFLTVAAPLAAQTVNTQSTGVYYPTSGSGTAAVYCNSVDPTAAGQDRSFITTSNPESNRTDNDPWVSSALIEYDQPYPTPTSIGYPNHCLGLCAEFSCSNLPVGQSTYSIAFPLQRITFDVFKYYNGKNPKNPDELPTIRSIDVYPKGYNDDYTKYTCGSYHCTNAGADDDTDLADCLGAHWICNGTTEGVSKCWRSTTNSSACEGVTPCTYGSNCNCYYYHDGVDTSSADIYRGCNTGTGHSDCVLFDKNGAETNTSLPFCTGWDASYEMAGEFGKTNGQFGFRATAYTNVPSDGVIADRIEIEETGVYPGHNGATQIPIQIDVTNVHTVRSTPSLVGSITPVSAQPYTFTYRLSKDADVRIAIFDASTLDNAAYAYAAENGYNNSSNEVNFAEVYDGEDVQDWSATKKIVRTLVDWQPRTGEGIKGNDKDTQIADFDSWDGRNDNGLLLPAGNYLASIQAKSQDEWAGIDFSRAVTRQVSLDPLKLTDIQVMGLNKKSTAYATISYVPTEPSTVYWEVYTPGTVFQNTTAQNGVSEVLTNSSYPTGTGPKVDSTAGNVTGSLVYRSSEEKSGRMNYTQRWDGTCQALDDNGNPANCVRTYAAGERKSNGQIATAGETEIFAYGAPMPDGNYVYVLWAEIPYNGCYHNAADSVGTGHGSDEYYGSPRFEPNVSCTPSVANNNKQFTGVKTLKYTIGTLELERGLVGITLHPVAYSTLGSTPNVSGLDPFTFRYALDREAQVIATVENTAGVVVKHLTLEEGEPGLAQQLNTLTWDGRDDQGRMVYPGTYMFRVKALDAMFPARSNEMITIFPVDMYRLVDVSTTDVYGDSNAKATISYHLSKPMYAQINIYNKDVVIPDYNGSTGEYNDAKVKATYNGTATNVTAAKLSDGTLEIVPVGGTSATSGASIPVEGSLVTYDATNCGGNVCRNTWSSAIERNIVGRRDLNEDLTNLDDTTNNERATGTYTVYLKQEVLDLTVDTNAVWPPRICNKTTDADIFTSGHVDPALVNQKKRACIYVNDITFTNYPATEQEAASGVVDVRLQPIHTFDRSKLSVGDYAMNMEEWDALYFYNPTPSAEKHTQAEIDKCTGPNSTKQKANCPYEMVPDGVYPFYISARSNEPFNRYYYDNKRDGSSTTYNNISGSPFKTPTEVKQEDYLYASDKVVSNIHVTRGPVYFLEGMVDVFPNAPQLFNASSTTLTFIPPYEINFAISRAATVEVAVVALEPNMCSPVTDNVLSGKVNVYETRTNAAGDICKFLSTMTILNTGHFDPNTIRKIYWDGTDHNGNYVKPGMYEFRLTARNYPDPGLYQATVKSIKKSVDIFKVYDLLEADNYAISARGQDMKIGYQISVPMKVAVQIFKPGTTIYDYAKGTLRNPTTGREVKDIREVLVRAIVGIRPGTTLIEELWDGRDYAQQEVPDGVYPFRFVTSTDSAAIDSVTGEILDAFGDDTSTDPTKWKVNRVGDTYEYQNLHRATIAIGDGQFVCEDWKKTVFFYPNPLRDASRGTLEITKMPVPGTVSIKYFNIAGDMVRDSDYTCVDANNYQTTMTDSLYFQPDNNVSTTQADLDQIPNVRNAALRCKWDRTNQHGKKVARGVYFGLVDFKAYNGREHCQKVVKILIP